MNEEHIIIRKIENGWLIREGDTPRSPMVGRQWSATDVTLSSIVVLACEVIWPRSDET